MSGKVNPTRQSCNEVMARLGFDYELRRVSVIWAARSQPCPRCDATAFNFCVNLTKLKQQDRRVATRWPHDERVDWDKLLTALEKKEALSG